MIAPCAHLDLEVTEEEVTVLRGVAVPIYGWNPELEADVPLLRCSVCDATVRLPGPAVRIRLRVVAPNRYGGWDLL